ncbi:hypothetical protein ONZ45_g9289 [Pleurotus djamor]|nr:hypothetical protein ONZ45_g9289 [Pleurotus djamor]
MLSTTKLGCLFAALPFALASSPIVAWSSHRTTALDALPATLKSGSELAGLLSDDRLCENDAILVVDHPGLHASDFRNLPPTSPLSLALRDAPSSRQFPYVSIDDGHVVSLAEAVSTRCGARLVTLTQEQGHVPLSAGEKHVVCMSMPHLTEEKMADRHTALSSHIDFLESTLASIAESFPEYVVVYAGSRSALSKRQAVSETVQEPAKVALPSGGIFKRYQLLSPALISVLLVSFFILFPLLFVGISALSSIQSPLRVEAPKGYSDKERKNQ